MKKPIFAALLICGTSMPAIAYAQDMETETTEMQDAGDEMASDEMTDEMADDNAIATVDSEALVQETMVADETVAPEYEAQSTAMASYQEGLAMLEAGDNAGAKAKFDSALPVLRTIATSRANEAAVQQFIASALSQAANAEIGLGNSSAATALQTEAIDHWRAAYFSDKTNMPARNLLLEFLNSAGDAKILAGMNADAGPYFSEAMAIADDAMTTMPDDTDLANYKLTALVGLHRVDDSAGYLDMAEVIAADLKAKGAVSARNRNSVDALTGDS